MGMVNTLRMAVVGIVFATFLGVIVGLARLSNNWLIKRLAGLWIETLRNVPLLVQMIFYFAVLTALPRVSLESGPIHGWFHVSNKGISMPRVFISDGFYQWITVVAVGCIVAYFLKKQREKKHDLTGEDTHAVSWAFLIVCTFAIIGIFVHPIFSFVGEIFAALATLFENIPTTHVKILISKILNFFAARWIRNFFASRRSATGHLSLIDDDIFRMVFVGSGALIAIIVVISWTGISSWILNSGRAVSYTHLTLPTNREV